MMDTQPVYLKPNVLIEPLFNQWYAWPHLIAPASAAMYVANLHLSIMKSYVRSPQIHAAATKNPALMGGPFIDYDGQRVDEIKSLIQLTSDKQAHLLEFAAAVQRLDELLRKEAKGFALASLYEKVPAPLKGYVELVYELNNSPSIRFMEGLLYQSPYYDEAAQSISLSLITEDYRPFVLSTPRLPDEHHLQLHIPFKDELIDELCRLRQTPQPLAYVRELLQVQPSGEALFQSLLTADAPRAAEPSPKYDGEGVRIRYFGHASMLFETKEVCIFTDPSVSYDYDNAINRYTFDDLPEVIDYVLLTHAHQDHILLETLLQLRHKIKHLVVPRSLGGTLADPSLKRIMQQLGFKSVIELDEMESLEVEGGRIMGLPFLGEHADLNIRSKTAYSIELHGRTAVCAADSDNIEPQLYHHVRHMIGPVDALFLGMECDGAPLSWVYGPLLTQALDRKMDQSRRLSGSDYRKARELVAALDCKQVFVYAMGQEPWLNHIMCLRYAEDSPQIVESNKLLSFCAEKGIPAERLFGQKELVL